MLSVFFVSMFFYTRMSENGESNVNIELVVHTPINLRLAIIDTAVRIFGSHDDFVVKTKKKLRNAKFNENYLSYLEWSVEQLYLVIDALKRETVNSASTPAPRHMEADLSAVREKQRIQLRKLLNDINLQLTDGFKHAKKKEYISALSDIYFRVGSLNGAITKTDFNSSQDIELFSSVYVSLKNELDYMSSFYYGVIDSVLGKMQAKIKKFIAGKSKRAKKFPLLCVRDEKERAISY